MREKDVMTILVGLVDSGISGPANTHVERAARFDVSDDGVRTGTATPDKLRHGTTLANVILHQAPSCRLLNAQVFGDKAVTSPAAVAEAVAWSMQQGARVINLSVGLVHDRLVLRQACQKAISQGVILLASSPARGTPVFPAGYAGVIRVSGDARCGEGDISYLNNSQADFGACPRGLSHDEGAGGGASYSVAWVTGLVARYLEQSPGAGNEQITRFIAGIASFQGAERRLS